MLLTSPSKAIQLIAINTKKNRLELEFTQQVLSERSGVPLPTLRKFEQRGVISLESFLKLQMALGGLENIVRATETKESEYSSIDEVLESPKKHTRKRGRRK